MNPDSTKTHSAEANDNAGPSSRYNSGSIEVVKKVKEDILFLQDRIERMKNADSPNLTMLKNYESMLESRSALLQWLEENGDMDDNAFHSDSSQQTC